jgi:hypothetical protein
MLDRLEAHKGKVKVGGLCVLAVIGLAMLKGCGGSSSVGGAVVEAQRFVVRGTDGKPRAVLGMIDGDRTYLSLYDSGGKERAAVGVEDDGPSVKLYNAEGKMQAVLDLLGERPRLTLFDENGRVSHKAP